MRTDLIGWVVAGGVSVVMGGALFLTHQRVTELEARIGHVDDNFVQLSVPVEEAIREISTIYAEIDALRSGGGSKDQPGTVVRRNITPPRQQAPALPSSVPPVDDGSVNEDYAMPGPDGLTNAQRQRALQAKNGVFNDFNPDEDNED